MAAAARASNVERPELGYESMSHFVIDTDAAAVMLMNIDFCSGRHSHPQHKSKVLSTWWQNNNRHNNKCVSCNHLSWHRRNQARVNSFQVGNVYSLIVQSIGQCKHFHFGWSEYFLWSKTQSSVLNGKTGLFNVHVCVSLGAGDDEEDDPDGGDESELDFGSRY